MSSIRLVALTLGVAVALIGGVLGTPTATANTPTNSAFALSASGMLQVDPIPNVTNTRGFAQDSVAEFSTPDRAVRAKVLNAEAGQGHAKASVTDLTVDLSPVEGLNIGASTLTATAVESVCDQETARSSLAGARLGNQILDVAAPANTKVEVAGLASVVLNKQVLHEDGSVTVTAVSISITGVQTLDIASATCGATSGGDEHPQPPAPTTLPTPDDDGTATEGGTAEGGTTVPGQAPRPTPITGHLDVTG